MHGVLQPRLDMELGLSGSEEVFARGNSKRCAEQERMSCHLDHHLFHFEFHRRFMPCHLLPRTFINICKTRCAFEICLFMRICRRDTMRMKQLDVFDVAFSDCNEPVSLVFMSGLD